MSLEEKLINPLSFSRPKCRLDIDGRRTLADVYVNFTPLIKCSKIQRLNLVAKGSSDCILGYSKINADSLWIRNFLQKEAKKWATLKLSMRGMHCVI